MDSAVRIIVVCSMYHSNQQKKKERKEPLQIILSMFFFLMAGMIYFIVWTLRIWYFICISSAFYWHINSTR